MLLLRSLHSPRLPKSIAASGCALTIGNFDAVHLGHQHLLKTLVAQAKTRNLPTIVMTFDPHPQEYFRAATGDAPPRLTTIATRYFAIRKLGIDILLSLRFNRTLAQTPATQFIHQVLHDRLHTRYLLLGDDFRFGANRSGDFNLLARTAEKYHYQVERINRITHPHQTAQNSDPKSKPQRISSTTLRHLLAHGDLPQAEKLLGHPYTHTGRIIHGDKRGRKLGFPTLNLPIRHRPPLNGIFAVRIHGLPHPTPPHFGVASLGTRPTLKSTTPPQTLLEIHLFNYTETTPDTAYGKRICVEFLAKIRDEKKFPTLQALQAQMHQDAHLARQHIQTLPKTQNE